MTSRKRSGSGSSKRPKEKVVYIYELFLHGEDPSNQNPEFWNEFFLLQPNVEAFDCEISKLSNEHLFSVRNNLNLMFSKCIDMLESSKLYSIHFVLHLLVSCKDFYNFFIY